MRTYEILDAHGAVLHAQETDDSMAPVLIAGQSARLVAVNGERLAKASRVAVGPDAPPAPDVADLETEAETAEKRAAAKAAKSAAKATPSGDASRVKGGSADAADPAA